MYLIVGLGNPEPEYGRTRHNMGFDVINKIAKKYEIELTRNSFNAIKYYIISFFSTNVIRNKFMRYMINFNITSYQF